jgi:hypothetical protein
MSNEQAGGAFSVIAYDANTSFYLNSNNFISGPGRSLSPDKEAMNDPKRRN